MARATYAYGGIHACSKQQPVAMPLPHDLPTLTLDDLDLVARRLKYWLVQVHMEGRPRCMPPAEFGSRSMLGVIGIVLLARTLRFR
jgi:hypothetical protein